MPKGCALEYHGENPCIPRAALVELNFRLRPRWENQKTKLRPLILPCGWKLNLHVGGIKREWVKEDAK
jgi:hypothetical protein